MLVMGDGGDSASIENTLKFSPRSGAFRLVMGILTALTGILKLLSPSVDNIPILGDLVPALAGIVAGFILVFGYYRENASPPLEEGGGKLDRIGEIFLHYKKAAGIILLAAALLHFLFPQALFL